jgi:hypothetical protein
MLLNKTPRAHAALQAGSVAGLGMQERRILILTDGKRSLNEVMALLGPDILPRIDRLLREGYISNGQPQAAPLAAPQVAPQAATFVAPQAPQPAAPQAVRSGHRRSLVAAKMYMIDMLQLQKHPDAVELKARIQFSNGDAALLDAIVEGVQVLLRLTGERYVQRVLARLEESLPEPHLPRLATLHHAAAAMAPAPPLLKRVGH